MANRLRWTRGEKGFTLVELMVVVAILGLVAAIAIPNFLRYQGKSRQAEAKTALGGIFAGQMAYYGENNSFGNFNQIGFILAGSSNRYGYRSGAAGPGGGPSTGGAGADLINPCCAFPLQPEQGGIQATNSVPLAAPGFTATATANLDNDPTVDQWYVNDLKAGLQSANPDDVTT